MRQNKFTLIELLVVIGIIGVLVSLLMPALSSARDAARAIVCKSNMKQINHCLQNYMSSYDNYIPSGFVSYFGTQADCPDEFTITLQKVAFAGTGATFSGYQMTSTWKKSMIFACPSDKNPNHFNRMSGGDMRFTSYGFNRTYVEKRSNPLGYGASTPSYRYARPISSIKRAPSEAAIMGEQANDMDEQGCLIQNADTLIPNPTAPGELKRGYCAVRHGGVQSNFSFLDTHVETVVIYPSIPVFFIWDFDTWD